jgi:hypothetical protein
MRKRVRGQIGDQGLSLADTKRLGSNKLGLKWRTSEDWLLRRYHLHLLSRVARGGHAAKAETGPVRTGRAPPA